MTLEKEHRKILIKGKKYKWWICSKTFSSSISSNLIKSGLRDFKEEIENMSKEEKETEQRSEQPCLIDNI